MAGEAAKGFLLGDIPIRIWDARALIKAWGKYMTQLTMSAMSTTPGFKRTKAELT